MLCISDTNTVEIEQNRMSAVGERKDQRYTADGVRLVVGAVPFLVREGTLLVIMITAAKHPEEVSLPKGGWESWDETMAAGAARETWEEGGIEGKIGSTAIAEGSVVLNSLIV